MSKFPNCYCPKCNTPCDTECLEEGIKLQNEKYEKLHNFVRGMAKKSCCNLHCYSCDALQLLREIGEDGE